MTSKIFNKIEIGKKYNIAWDRSGKYVTLQYLFKPISISDQISGDVRASKSNTVDVTIASNDGVEEKFKGTKRCFAETDHEYILAMDESMTFKMVKVDQAMLNLRVQRAENISKLKEASSKESKLALESMKLPKFLQKQQKKKLVSANIDKSATIEGVNPEVKSTNDVETSPGGPTSFQDDSV